MKILKKMLLAMFIFIASLFIPFWSYTVGFKSGFNKMNNICFKSSCETSVANKQGKCVWLTTFDNVYKFWEL